MGRRTREVFDLHEASGNMDGQTPAAEAMDRHNNDIGIDVGKNASSWREVIERARQAISDSIGEDLVRIGSQSPSGPSIPETMQGRKFQMETRA